MIEPVRIGDATLYQGDCLQIMQGLGEVDAVVTDPPYGIGEAAGKNRSRCNLAVARDYGDAPWDDQTCPEGVDLARSISRRQIVFGGNYYDLPPTSCWLIWDKLNTGDFADCEMAWTNLPTTVRRLRYLWNGMLRANGEEKHGHPTQKPLGVMKWCLGFLPDAQTILDPFMGSGTTGVACAKLGRKFIGIEREPRYFDIACKRIEQAYAQPDLFIEPPKRAEQLEAMF